MTASRSADPQRGERRRGALAPVLGSEQAGRRPVVIVSFDDFLRTGANRAAIVPDATKFRPLPSWVAIGPPERREPSWALPDQIRTVDFARLNPRISRVDGATMAEIDRVPRLVLGH